MKEHEKFYLLNTTTEWNSSLIVHLVEIRPGFFSGFYARIQFEMLEIAKNGRVIHCVPIFSCEVRIKSVFNDKLRTI